MTAALRCDWCGSVVTEDDDVHADWLRVERNGHGLGPLGPIPTISVEAPVYGAMDGEGFETGQDDDAQAGPVDPAPIRHFCGWSCLSGYSHQAEGLR